MPLHECCWFFFFYTSPHKGTFMTSFIKSTSSRAFLSASCKGSPSISAPCSFFGPPRIKEHSWLEQWASALKPLVKPTEGGKRRTRPGVAFYGNSHLSPRTNTKQLARHNSDWPPWGRVTSADKYSNKWLIAYQRSWKMWKANQPPKNPLGLHSWHTLEHCLATRQLG